jgi:hypothetical protein
MRSPAWSSELGEAICGLIADALVFARYLQAARRAEPSHREASCSDVACANEPIIF